MRVLGIDLGERRIGLALADPTGTLATPWRTIAASGALADVVETIARAIEPLVGGEEPLVQIVIGLPRRLDGSPTDQTARATAFGAALAARVSVPIVFQDERLTSHEADRRLAERERDWRRRKARLDAAAAAIILQDFLDRRPAARAARSGEDG